MSKESIRCFLGVPLEPEVNDALDLIVADLNLLPAARRVRWVDAANRHLTLAFLGDQSLAAVFDLQAALQAVCSSNKAFPLRSQRVSGFPDAKSSIVALELEAADPLLKLVADIRSVLTGHGFPGEVRRYRPHVTLGRMRRGQSWKQPPQSCELRLTITSVELYQSRLSTAGARYTPLWSLPL
ncbi:MAG: RNA 2',3'-cyclic phosphodiesterase [Ketobacter sp.]|nr:MAG: RNA 2',3'-cyclic phosphodiesterase [Ketobacter sp.]